MSLPYIKPDSCNPWKLALDSRWVTNALDKGFYNMQKDYRIVKFQE
jgi:hypothetical protein